MFDDDKTTEIVLPPQIPTTTAALSTANLNSAKTAQFNRRKTDPQVTHPATNSNPTWLGVLQQEWREDWTLRVLAALTILVLSLLVL